MGKRVVRTIGAMAIVAVLVTPAAAQAPAGWRLSAGGGPAVLLAGHDASSRGQVSPGIRVALDHGLSPSLALGVEWIATWPSSGFGGENRHHMGLVATAYPLQNGLAVYGGLGLGLATIVTIEGPPPAPYVGDVNIGIGDTMGPGATAGLAWEIRLGGGLTVTPTAQALLQEIQGFRLAHAFFGVRLSAGRR